jgi:hypothetical protein
VSRKRAFERKNVFMVKIYVFRKGESSSKLVGLQRDSPKLVPMAGPRNPYDECHHKS